MERLKNKTRETRIGSESSVMVGKKTRSHLPEMERSEVEMRRAIFRAIVTASPQRIEKRGRRQILSTAAFLDRILFACKTGCPWRSLEVQGASPKTVYHHFNRWSKRRVFERAFSDLRSLDVKRHAGGEKRSQAGGRETHWRPRESLEPNKTAL